MNNSLLSSSAFTLNRQPVFYIRQNEVLSPSIQISPVADKEFCVPVYTGAEFDGASIRMIQAQGVDSLGDSLQDALDALNECDYGGVVTQAIGDEIARCRAFAERLRNPVIKLCLCDSCNDWLRGGCSSTCNAYRKDANSDSTDYSYQGKFPVMKFAEVRDEHQ